MAAAAERAASALAPLPKPLALRIFAALPADACARCACVCRAWRDAVADESLWLHLDLTRAGGVPLSLATDAVLRAAAARAGGRLQRLAVEASEHLTWDGVLNVATANAASLRELRLDGRPDDDEWLSVDDLKALLRAAPALTACELDLRVANVAETRAVLRCEPPFEALRMHSLSLSCAHMRDGADLREVAAQVAQYEHALTELYVNFENADILIAPAALDAFVDAALSQRCASFVIWGRDMRPATAPGLARLLRGGALTDLAIYNTNLDTLLDVPSATLLAGALRSATTLRSLFLWCAELFFEPAAARIIMDALVGHPSLRRLTLIGCDSEDNAHTGALLGALVSSPDGALEDLRIDSLVIDDATMRPLFEALPRNTKLRELDCMHNLRSAAFVRDVVLPAVRANTSLRVLYVASRAFGVPNECERLLRQAEALVKRRATLQQRAAEAA